MNIVDPSFTSSDKTFKHENFDTQKIVEKEFRQCIFIKCSFRETLLQKCKFSECSFDQCDFSNSKVINSSFISSPFAHCKMIGMNWTLASWTSLMTVSFDSCDVSFSNFFGLKLHNLTMINCIAKEADFAETDMTKADMHKTDFLGARFLNTNLTEVNFIGAINYAIDVKMNKVKKARFSLPEALSLLNAFDIKIVDTD